MCKRVLIYDVDFKSSGTEYPIKDSFEACGWSADMFDWSKFLYSYDKPNIANRIKDRVFFDCVSRKINKALLGIVKNKKYDLLLVKRGEHIYPETITLLKRQVQMVVNWSPDDLFNKLNSSRFIQPAIPLYDIHFSPRRHLRDEYLENGAKHFEVLDWYYMKELQLQRQHVENSLYNYEISFVGSWSARRESLLKCLRQSKFDVFGWGWQKKVTLVPANWQIHKMVGMKDMINIFSRSKININIFTVENRDHLNLRTFDLCAAGAFQISEVTDELLEIFQEGVDIVCFNSAEELKSKSEYYLRNDAARDRIRIAAYNKITSGNFELRSRVQKIIDVVTV